MTVLNWKVEEFDRRIKLERAALSESGVGAVYIFDGVREVAACRFNERDGGAPLDSALATARQIVKDHNSAIGMRTAITAWLNA